MIGSNWLVAAGFLIFVAIYFMGVRYLRRSADRRMAGSAASTDDEFSPSEIDRYSRHIVLREIGGTGQRKLRASRVLVVGAGGLGSPALLYLSAAGVGTIGVVDYDNVELSNLQRQVIHRDKSAGFPKTASAQTAMGLLNPLVRVCTYNMRISSDNAEELISKYDVVVDGSDDFDTRMLVNKICLRTGKPLVFGAISQWEGQVSVFDAGSESPCYACLFPASAAAGLAPTCAEAGVVNALPGVIGSMMALETIKLLVGAGDILVGRVMIYDALCSEIRVINFARRADCRVCGSGYED